eukprot:469832_1
MGQALTPCGPLIQREDSVGSINETFKTAIDTQNESLIRQLVDEHSEFNLLDITFPDGSGVVHVAVQQQNLNLTQYFLSNGLSANQKNENNGDTPLHIASRLRNIKIVDLLTRYGGDTSIANYKNETPKSIASNVLKEYTQLVHLLDAAEANQNKLNQQLQSQLSPLDEDTESPAGIKNGVFTVSEVAKHASVEDGIWVIIGGTVYDITSFIKRNLHPATNEFVEPYYGRDATEPFDATFHSIEAVRVLKTYEIGKIHEEEPVKPRRRAASLQKSLKDVLNSSGSFRSRIRVHELFLFPVKGMKGISVQKAKLTLSGFVDDRIYAVVHKATNKVINQLTFPRLSQIAVAFQDGTDNCDAGILLNDHFVPFVKDKTLSVEWKSCSTKILAYDQGEAVSKWITSYLSGDDEFVLVRIHEENYRETEEYFALPFAPAETQRMSAFQNYAPVNLASQESMDELDRRYRETEHGPKDEGEIDWERFRFNVTISGVFMAHHEDFMKTMSFGDLSQSSERAQILWSRRRYFCAVPQVNQTTSISTLEPLATARSYRNAITLNDRTAMPGDDAVFFGSLFCVKHSGMIHVGQSVVSEHEQLEYDTLRTACGKSYFGLTEQNIGSQFEINYHAQYEEFELLAREEYNHDTIRVRFGMIIKAHHVFRKSLRESLRMGDHYLLKYLSHDTPIIRAYSPLFDDDEDDDKMSFELLVKVYPKGRMTQHLKRMKIGDTILCKKNYGKMCYFEIGKIRFGDPRMTMFAPYNLNVNRLNLIAGGSGIVPMYQIIKNIDLNKEFDHTKISLIYANKTEKDILLRDKLEAIQKGNENVSIHFVIEETDSNQFDIGRVNVDICKRYLAPPNVDDNAHVVTLLCGPYPMQKAVKQCLTQIGYDAKSVGTF